VVRCVVRWCVVAGCSLAAGAASVGAQVAGAEITGIVKDQAGAAVPGATVTVTNVATNRQYVVPSGGEGIYTAPSVVPGDYRVDVELSGFKSLRRDGIHLATGEKARIDFELAVGDVREQITVMQAARCACGRCRDSWWSRPRPRS
jgi:hypothetical protein